MAGYASDRPRAKDACSEERVKILEGRNTTIQMHLSLDLTSVTLS